MTFEVDLPPLAPPELSEVEAARLEGFWAAVAVTQPFLDQARSDADRYYAAAAAGTFKVPMRSQGSTFAELEARRNAGAK
jgi:hypothetical protein